MALTVSLVVLFGIVLGLLLKAKSLGYGSAIVAVLFGFLLASTGVAGPINNLIHALTDAIAKVRA
ncbi:hypothetical protein [Kitasatospora griseola]|uniref:Uncharacterized protein n=1 Tax=Kitasatospora griseola TaxID=2064 RepID=A0A0D0PNB9_KITGR|nr:hypothetical protein [Kitasatospora griseola]KIQ61997.1 hypothetical protein TR51_22580 [Kitasatospora griseola]GGQ89513.1 hypothetical protein GCM10010195_51670 [Kitasatospora griseola]GGR09305.1 hypothetical protein GCM10010195_74700 [Kitasatospora griseola]